MGYAQRQAQTVELTLNTSFVLSKCGQMIEQKNSISDLLVTSLNTDMNVSENLPCQWTETSSVSLWVLV